MRVISSLLVLLVVVPVTGCGDDGGVDRSSYASVYDAAMEAVAARDLQALEPLLTDAGWHRLQATLRDFQQRLQDPVQGRRILDLASEGRGPIDPAELEGARHGPVEEAWIFLLRADPRPPVPTRVAVRKRGDAMLVEYADPRGTLRSVTLVQGPDGWAIDDLQL